jgi:hypothetical protein
MLGRRPATPSNESVVAVPVFTPDPHGAAMFAGITNGNIGHLGTRPVIDTDRAPWRGWTAPPQRMTGAANIGRGRPVVPAGSTLDQERGLSADPIQAIFEQRMTARRFS